MSAARKRQLRRSLLGRHVHAIYDENKSLLTFVTVRNGVRHEYVLELGHNEYSNAAFIARQFRKHVEVATARLRDEAARSERALAELGVKP